MSREMSDDMPKYFMHWLDDWHYQFVYRHGLDEHIFELKMIFSVVQIARGDLGIPESDKIAHVRRFIIANPEKCIKEIIRRYEALEKVEAEK